MTDRLIRITTALAVIAVAGVAAINSYQHAYELISSPRRDWRHGPPTPVHTGRLDLGSIDGGARRQPSEPPCTTPGQVELGRRHRGHGRCQPGSRPGPWPDRRSDQRLAGPSAGWFLRTTHVASQDSPARRLRWFHWCRPEALSATDGPLRSVRGAYGDVAGTDRAGLARLGPQPGSHSPANSTSTAAGCRRSSTAPPRNSRAKSPCRRIIAAGDSFASPRTRRP